MVKNYKCSLRLVHDTALYASGGRLRKVVTATAWSYMEELRKAGRSTHELEGMRSSWQLQERRPRMIVFHVDMRFIKNLGESCTGTRISGDAYCPESCCVKGGLWTRSNDSCGETSPSQSVPFVIISVEGVETNDELTKETCIEPNFSRVASRNVFDMSNRKHFVDTCCSMCLLVLDMLRRMLILAAQINSDGRHNAFNATLLISRLRRPRRDIGNAGFDGIRSNKNSVYLG
ncbi:uncharacterized protein EDB91DRAFT_1338827 [Suillus paluster]|uniref:uncharacterized protein n=1 Tax=Suillus paluster TaxID=48578 RepID=UPI001B870BEE|nr:uncharacterized protein EDB91DRAFT_1338827 [Suillus paluster]KAG1730553.1 hypothetical protein EDB91DRAFT_1338827 [Suillus paluster]